MIVLCFGSTLVVQKYDHYALQATRFSGVFRKSKVLLKKKSLMVSSLAYVAAMSIMNMKAF